MQKFQILLKEFKEVTRQVNNLIDKYPPDKRDLLLFDKWSLKDVVAHLNHWMVHDIDCLGCLSRNEEPYWEPDVEEFNLKGVASRKNKTWDEIYNEFATLIDRLIKIYESLPEEMCDKKIWKNKTETPSTFLQEDINHWREEHTPPLTKRLQF